jgi:hypothetical protein
VAQLPNLHVAMTIKADGNQIWSAHFNDGF